jgi:hypothetical protein
MTALRPIAVGCGKKGNFRFGSDLTRSPVFAECPLFALTGRLESTDIPNGEGGESNDKKQFTPLG